MQYCRLHKRNGERIVRADGKIDFVEFEGTDLAEVRRFYKAALGWTFHGNDTEDAAFSASDDGDEAANDNSPPAPPLVVIYFDSLSAVWRKVQAAGGEITKPVYWIPGGWRFQFRDPAGNELAVWSRQWATPTPKESPEASASAKEGAAEWCEGNQLAPTDQWDVLVA
jgi:predicted enzyme related to lactoylglutathione lyase